MSDKQYLSEKVLQLVLHQLEDLKRQSIDPRILNLTVLQSLIEKAQHQT